MSDPLLLAPPVDPLAAFFRRIAATVPTARTIRANATQIGEWLDGRSLQYLIAKASGEGWLVRLDKTGQFRFDRAPS